MLLQIFVNTLGLVCKLDLALCQEQLVGNFDVGAHSGGGATRLGEHGGGRGVEIGGFCPSLSHKHNRPHYCPISGDKSTATVSPSFQETQTTRGGKSLQGGKGQNVENYDKIWSTYFHSVPHYKGVGHFLKH